MSSDRRHALVLGGTGILRPAADALAARGWTVTAIETGARPSGEGQRLLALDATDAPALAGALDDDVRDHGGRYEAAIVYAPITGWPALEAVAQRTDGTLVDVLTSGAAAPDSDPAPVARPGQCQRPCGSAPAAAWLDGEIAALPQPARGRRGGGRAARSGRAGESHAWRRAPVERPA